MDSDFGVLLADLTSSGDESLDQLLVPDDDLGYHVVGNGGVFLLTVGILVCIGVFVVANEDVQTLLERIDRTGLRDSGDRRSRDA